MPCGMAADPRTVRRRTAGGALWQQCPDLLPCGQQRRDAVAPLCGPVHPAGRGRTAGLGRSCRVSPPALPQGRDARLRPQGSGVRPVAAFAARGPVQLPGPEHQCGPPLCAGGRLRRHRRIQAGPAGGCGKRAGPQLSGRLHGRSGALSRGPAAFSGGPALQGRCRAGTAGAHRPDPLQSGHGLPAAGRAPCRGPLLPGMHQGRPGTRLCPPASGAAVRGGRTPQRGPALL